MSRASGLRAECLRDTKLSEARKASVVMLLAGYVRGIASTEFAVAVAVRGSGLGPGEWMASYAMMLRRLADPQRFPALADFIAAGVFDEPTGPTTSSSSAWSAPWTGSRR